MILIWAGILLHRAEIVSEERMWVGVNAMQIIVERNSRGFNYTSAELARCNTVVKNIPFYRYLSPFYSRQEIRADMNLRMREGCERDEKQIQGDMSG